MNISSLRIPEFNQVKQIQNNFSKTHEIQSPCLNFTSLFPKTRNASDIQVNLAKEQDFFRSFLTKKGKVTFKEYQDIKKNHPYTLAKAYKKVEGFDFVQSSPKATAKAAVKLKEFYDEKYDKNYTILSIGTSPAPITEAMSALGSKVIFVPISGLRDLEKNRLYVFRHQYPTMASRFENLDFVVKYLRKKGVKPSNDEHMLLLDYCCSGASLSNFSQILREEKMINPDKMHEHSILPDLAELTNLKDKNSFFKLEDFANISADMQKSNFQDVSNVPHFYFKDDDNKNMLNAVTSKGKSKHKLFKQFDNFSQENARVYALCVINEAMKILNHNNS